MSTSVATKRPVVCRSEAQAEAAAVIGAIEEVIRYNGTTAKTLDLACKSLLSKGRYDIVRVLEGVIVQATQTKELLRKLLDAQAKEEQSSSFKKWKLYAPSEGDFAFA